MNGMQLGANGNKIQFERQGVGVIHELTISGNDAKDIKAFFFDDPKGSDKTCKGVLQMFENAGPKESLHIMLWATPESLSKINGMFGSQETGGGTQKPEKLEVSLEIETWRLSLKDKEDDREMKDQIEKVKLEGIIDTGKPTIMFPAENQNGYMLMGCEFYLAPVKPAVTIMIDEFANGHAEAFKWGVA